MRDKKDCELLSDVSFTKLNTLCDCEVDECKYLDEKFNAAAQTSLKNLKPVVPVNNEQLQNIANKIFCDFNIDVEYGGDFDAFYNKYFKL